MATDKPRRIGLVLPAGGARAAYQVGVLRCLAEEIPEFTPSIFTGVSAGSINACFLAQGEPFPLATQKAYHLWEKLEFKEVLNTNFKSLLGMGARWVSDLFLSKVTRRLLVKSLLDAGPLANTLLQHIHFWKISRAVRSGVVQGVAVSATNYHNGATTIFFDSSDPVPEWRREQRRAVRTALRTRHVMASCSIPILFEPIRIGDYLYGDGSLRFSFPFSPALQLGSSHVFAIGIRCPSPEDALGDRPDHVSLGFVAGVVLNSIFLDSVEADYENLCRINRRAGSGGSLKPGYLMRPSQDLGAIAKDFLGEVPFHLRQLLRSTANPAELGDLLSYLMFSPGYLRALLELGMKDGKQKAEEVRAFLKS